MSNKTKVATAVAAQINADVLAMDIVTFTDYVLEQADTLLAASVSEHNFASNKTQDSLDAGYNGGNGVTRKSAILQVGWELRKALSRERSTMENLLALSYIKRLDVAMQGQPEVKAVRAMKRRPAVPAVVDANGKITKKAVFARPERQSVKAVPAKSPQECVLEVHAWLQTAVVQVADVLGSLFERYEPHAQAIAGMSSRAFDLSAYQRVISNVQEADAQDNSWMQAIEEDRDSMDDEARQFYDEYYKQQGLVTDMQQRDKSSHKENNQIVSSKDETKVNVIYENIDYDTYVTDRLERNLDEWKRAAGFGAWGLNILILSKALTANPQLREHLSERNQAKEVGYKTLIPMMVRFRSKEIDLQAGLARLAEYQGYLLYQESESERVGMTMPQNERLIELEVQIAEQELALELIKTMNAELNQNEAYMGLDNPLDVYVAYAGSDITPNVLKRLSQSDRALFAKAVVVDSFEFDETLKASQVLDGKQAKKVSLTSIKLRPTAGLDNNALVRIANAIGAVRYDEFVREQAKATANSIREAAKALTKGEVATPDNSDVQELLKSFM